MTTHREIKKIIRTLVFGLFTAWLSAARPHSALERGS
jgi:hypothetical protein